MKKKEKHPQWHHSSKVYCGGKLIMVIGSTKPKLKIDTWSYNHPYFLGSNNIFSNKGRIEQFMKKYNLKTIK